MTSRVRPSLSRRALLTAGGLAAAALASGCGTVDDLLSDDGGPSPAADSPSSDERLMAGALADQERLLAACIATRARHRSARKTLAPIIEHHREHVRILGGEPSSRGAGAGVPASPVAALTALQRKESAAAKDRADDAHRAESGELARVLAAVSASQLQHGFVLDAAIGALS